MSAQEPESSGETVGRLAREDVPFLFDAVSVGPDGLIAHSARDAITFSFDCQGATFTATARRVDKRVVVTVVSDLGPLPFSAESALARRAIQDFVLACSASTEPRLIINENQMIRIESSFELLQPVSPITMLTMVTKLLLELKPWLTRLGELIELAVQQPHGTA